MGAFYGLAVLGVEPVATFFFLFAWAGLIFTLDRLIARAEGASLMARLGGAGFLVVVGWSAVNWFAYELANLRLANWHYVFVTDDDGLRFVATVLAFGTVLPGVFWLDHLLRAHGVAAGVRGPRLQLGSRLLIGMQVLGAACLGLCLLDPSRLFPLIWAVTALLVAPLNHRRGIDGWLRQWQRGDYGPTLRMLLAGALAGLFWEFFNFWARAKWIYTVPFFDELKLFEMPVLGFVGFPPFALECACVYRLLVWYRLAPPFGAFSPSGPRRGWAVRAVACGVGLATTLGGYLAVDRVIVTSRTPRVVDVSALPQAHRQALLDLGVTHLTQLQGWAGGFHWRDLQTSFDDSGAAALRRVVDLYLHQGIGTEYGNRLVSAGYRSLDDLRGQGVDGVWEALRHTEAPGRVPSPAQVKVWLRRLPGDEGRHDADGS
jgi:hypothetical protein